MPPIPFPSDLYRAADWDFTNPIRDSDGLLRPIFARARRQVLADLRRSYYSAVEVYKLPPQTGCWVEEAPMQELAQQAGRIYVTLDYFAACLPLPRRMKSLGAKKEALLASYFCQRSLENLQANAEALLNALAVSSLIPDDWFPEKDLEKRIVNEIERSGRYSHVEVDLELHLPPGGLGYLSVLTARTVTRVRENLANGQPCVVRLVCSPGGLDGNRQAIVVACREQKGSKLRLEIFEPDGVLEQHALQIATRRGQAQLTEIRGSGQQPVLGLLYEAYTPAPIPRECIPWWLRWKALRQVWIRLLAWMLEKKLLRFR